MRDGKRESGRMMIIVVVALALSAGVITWKRASEAPEKAFRTGMDEYARRAFPRAAIAWKEADRLGHLEATQRLGLELPDPFPGNCQALADLLQGPGAVVVPAVAQAQDQGLALRQPVQPLLQGLVQFR